MADQIETVSPWERALVAAEKVKERLYHATRALDAAGVSYAVVGGNAVAEWVARMDEGAVRNTGDVDILIRRGDLGLVRTALESAGFVYCRSNDTEMFLDGPSGRPSSAVHIYFAGEKVRSDYILAAPSVDQSERAAEFQVIGLHTLVEMKLNSWRNRDRMHLYDMIGVGLIDASWPGRFAPPLAKRLQDLIDDPNG